MKFECSSPVLQAGWLSEHRIVVAVASAELLTYEVYPYGQGRKQTASLYQGPNVLFNAPAPQGKRGEVLTVEPGAFAAHPKVGCAIAYESLVAVVLVSQPVHMHSFPAQVTCLSFSSDGQFVAVGDRNGSVFLWTADFSQRLQTYQRKHTNPVEAIGWTQGKKQLLFSLEKGRLIQWEPWSGQELLQVRFPDRAFDITSVFSLPDKTFIISGIEAFYSESHKDMLIQGVYQQLSVHGEVF